MCIDFNIYRVKDLVFKASAGHKQYVFNKIQNIKAFCRKSLSFKQLKATTLNWMIDGKAYKISAQNKFTNY